MIKKETILALATGTILVSGTVNAASPGHGTVTFTGSIINAPCSITPDTIDQTVNLGQISYKMLASDGMSPPRSFQIKLENCDVTALADKTVTAMFTGTESTLRPGYLAIQGTASGASIAITADNGKNITLGQIAPATVIQDNNNTLRFAAYLHGSRKERVLPGEFTSVANFTLAYQ